jgi:hypothetical protein
MRVRVSVATMRRTLLLGFVVLVAAFGTVAADPDYRRAPIRVEWDSRGWQMLGERTVDGRYDHDRIDIGRYEGRFTKLTLVVHDNDLEMLDFVVRFADGTKFEPRLTHFFRENSRTRVIELPPGETIIRSIDIRYKNVFNGPRARMQVWGFKVASALPPPAWDSRGWEMLGERHIDGRVDRDRIDVGRYEGRFTKLTLVALDADFEMLDFRVKFGNGEVWSPTLRHYFRENTRTHVIDLPGDKRVIEKIDFTYRNLGYSGGARLQVWGLRARETPTYSFDSRGWTLVGEKTVNGRVDYDRIVAGRYEGRFRELMIVVLDSDIELLKFDVTFGNREVWRPEIRQVFRENTRTRSIELPGNHRARVIETIDLKYRNLFSGGSQARVQVWGR